MSKWGEKLKNAECKLPKAQTRMAAKGSEWKRKLPIKIDSKYALYNKVLHETTATK